MRVAAITFTCIAICAATLAGPLSRPAAADNTAAGALAEKFARAAEAQEQKQREKKAAEAAAKKAKIERAKAAAAKAARRKAEAQRAADEAEMLRQARAEAEARRAADQRAFEAQQRIEAAREKARLEQQKKARIAAEKEKARAAAKKEKARLAAEQEKARAEAARLAREAQAQRKEADRRAENARKLEAARLAREVAEKRRAEELAAETARRLKEADEKRLAAEKRAAEEKARADATRAKLEAMRTEEARRIAEKFRLAREARERARDTSGTRNSLGGPPPPPEMDEPAPWRVDARPVHTGPVNTGPVSKRVTVLLRIEPRRYRFGGKRKANPVLCFGRSCYISGGPGYNADRLSRWKTLGPVNSIGRRAGPCRNQTTCVFRNVDLGGPSAAMQPISMGFWHHDRHDIKTVRADRTCDVIARQLFCAIPVIGHRYRAWIVPEAVAAKAGADALEDALEAGLPSARSAKRGAWPIKVHAVPTR